MRHPTIPTRVDEPDYLDLPDHDHDWSETVYGEFKEIIPGDVPEPLGHFITCLHYVDDNHIHYILTGSSVTGVLHSHFCVDEPDYSDLPDHDHDWPKTVYGELKEIIPDDVEEPLGHFATCLNYVDANLMHHILTGREVIGSSIWSIESYSQLLPSSFQVNCQIKLLLLLLFEAG
jgi:hypothetical protein